jgi:hypothetical protein
MNAPESEGWVKLGGVCAWSRDGKAAARALLRRALDAEGARILSPGTIRPPGQWGAPPRREQS